MIKRLLALLALLSLLSTLTPAARLLADTAYAESAYAESAYAESAYAESAYAESAYAESAYAQTPITNPGAGAIYPWGDGHAARSGDLFAFPYRSQAGSDWLYLRNDAGAVAHIPLPDRFLSYERAGAEYALVGSTDFWIWSGVQGMSTLRHYRLTGSGTLPDTATLAAALPLGDHDSRPGGLLALQSGALVGMWYEHRYAADGHLDLGYLYIGASTGGADGQLSTMYPVRVDGTHGNALATETTLVQHPADGSIWAFFKRDGYPEIGAVWLTETAGGLKLGAIKPAYIGAADGDHAPDDELPYLASAPDSKRNTIRLAYQDRVSNTFYATDETGRLIGGTCPDPGPGILGPSVNVTGTYVSLAEIAADGTRSFTLFPTYVGPGWLFGLAIEREAWLVYQPVGCANTSVETYEGGPLYAASHNGSWSRPTYLGDIGNDLSGDASPVLYAATRSQFVTRLTDGSTRHWIMSSTGKPLADPTLTATATATATAATAATPAEYAPDAVLVRYKAGTTSQGKADARAAARARSAHAFHIVPDLEKLDVPDVGVALAALHGKGQVLYAEPDYIITPLETVPNDPRFGEEWGLSSIRAPAAWDITLGSAQIIVAIIDTGVDYTHPDLAANIWTNPGEVPGNNIDDDGNGWVDDVHGVDTYYGDSDPMDFAGHGTHVAGIVGAVGNNLQGVSGVNWQVRIMPVKYTSDSGSGTSSSAIDALDYAVQMGARISNNSWGSIGYSQGHYDAIKKAQAAGHILVAAAGNSAEDSDLHPVYPAAYDLDNVISVAALDSADALASFSNWGRVSVDLGAPGVNIVSTLRNAAYGGKSGTSMSAPYVSGVAALLFSVDPGAGFGALRNRILANVRPVPSLAGKTVTGGTLDAYAALSAALFTPTATSTATAAPAESGTPTATPTATPTLTPTPAATATSTAVASPTATPAQVLQSLVHVDDLDGASKQSGRNWKGHVAIRVIDDAGGSISGATVSGRWQGGFVGSGSCTTDSMGQCYVKSGNMPKDSSAIFAVQNIACPGCVYAAQANTDHDGDSDGSTITMSVAGALSLSAPDSSIGGQVWLDNDADGRADATTGDIPLPGISVVLRGDTIQATTSTNSGGHYLFEGLLPGSYFVQVGSGQAALASYMPTRRGSTADNDNRAQPYALTVATGFVDTSADFGYTYPASLTGAAWLDSNGNGLRDESPIQGVERVAVTIADAGGQVAGRVETAADGRYLLGNLLPGSYTVAADTPPGYVGTGPQGAAVALSLGEDRQGPAFGYVLPTGVLAYGLEAVAAGDHVALIWNVSGDDGAAFYVWRADNLKGIGMARLNEIAVRGDGSGKYHYEDFTALAGLTYFYWLESDAAAGRFGPVSAAALPMRVFLPLLVRH